MSSPSAPRALVSVAVVFFVNGAVYGSWVPRLPEVRIRAGLSIAGLGLTLSAAALLAIAATFGAGRLVDRVGSRAAVVGAGVFAVLALVGIGLARHAAVLVAALAVVSAGDVVQDVAMNVQAARLSGHRTTPVMNRLHGLWSLGTVAGGLTAVRLAASGVSVPTHLVATSGILAATTFVAAPGLLTDDEPAHSPARRSRPRRVGTAGLGLAVLGFLAIAIEMIPADWSAVRLVEDLEASPATAGLGFGAFSIGMLVGRMGGDELVRHVGAHRAITLGTVISAVGLTVAWFSTGPGAAIGGFAAAGLGAAPAFPQIYGWAARTEGLGPGAGIAAMTTGQRVGALLLPALVGALADTTALGVGAAAAIVTIPAAVALVVAVWHPSVASGR